MLHDSTQMSGIWKSRAAVGGFVDTEGEDWDSDLWHGDSQVQSSIMGNEHILKRTVKRDYNDTCPQLWLPWSLLSYILPMGS